MKQMLHANALRLQDKGVLIIGPAGSGKSTLTLALLERAKMRSEDCAFIADDYVDVYLRDSHYIAAVRPSIAGAIEIRGAGLFHLPFERETAISLCVMLTDSSQRLPDQNQCVDLGLPNFERHVKSLFLPMLAKTSVHNLCYAIEFTLFQKPWEAKF